jgi:hypothetical protein
MKASEVAELLTFIAAFDRRTIGLADVQAWQELEVIRRIDLPLAKRAVVLFMDQEPDAQGRSHYLDPHQFRRFVRKARELAETEKARERAKHQITRGPADPKPQDFDEIKAAANRARLAEMMGTQKP